MEEAEMECRKMIERDPFTPVKATNAPPSDSQPLPRVTVGHVARVMQTVFGSVNPIASKIRTMTPQQKLVVILLSLVDQANQENKLIRSLDPTISKLFDVYTTVCRERSLLDPVSRSEFFDLVSTIESTGIVTVSKARTAGSTSQTNTPSHRRQTLGYVGTPPSGASGRKGTPQSNRKLLLPPSCSSASKKTPLAIDGSSRLVLAADDRDIRQGIADAPFLLEFLEQGLPHSLLQDEQVL